MNNRGEKVWTDEHIKTNEWKIIFTVELSLTTEKKKQNKATLFKILTVKNLLLKSEQKFLDG